MTDNYDFKRLLGVFIGLFAIFAIKSIFEDDSGRIVSQEGRRVLSDKDKMKNVNEKLLQLESNHSQKEVFI